MILNLIFQFGTHIDETHHLIAQPGVYMAQLGDVGVCKSMMTLAKACVMNTHIFLPSL